jgi:hypothetical protein
MAGTPRDLAEPGPPRVSPWVVGIIIGFVIMAIANAFFIYTAVAGKDPIVSSYTDQPR